VNNNKSGKFFVGSLVIFLVLFGVVSMVLSNMKDVAKNVTAPASMDAEAIAERIQPVAEVNVGEPPVVEAPAVATAEDTAGGAGEQIVTSVCAACHAAGLMQSPKLGSADDWAPRIEKGIETLYTHAINGFNMMPAKGGRADLSDDDIKAAVDFMVSGAQ
jgi:cytochrome c5